MATYHIIFDGNNFISKIRHVVLASLYGKSRKDKFLEREKDKKEFREALDTIYNSFLTNFPSYDNIIFCVDSHSWRKKLVLSKGRKYKQSRKLDVNIDWVEHSRIVDEFLESKSFTVSKMGGLEADDLIYMWKNRIKERYKDSYIFIISTDNDLLQILDERTFLVNHIEKSKKIECIKGYLEPSSSEKKEEPSLIEESDFFDFEEVSFKDKGMSPYNYIQKLKRNFGKFKEVDIQEKLISKIYCGESGDDIPSCYEWENKRVTPKYVKSLYEYASEKDIPYTLKNLMRKENISMAKDIFEKVSKESIDFEEFYNNIRTNYRLIVLNDKTIPEIYLKRFEEYDI